MKLGKSIVEIRKKNNLTQEDFAKKFNVTRQTVSNWENEKSYPDLITLVKISDEFGYSLDTMLKENPNMTENMDKEMKMGKMLTKTYEKKVIIAIIGAIACFIVFVMSLLERKETAFIWLIATIYDIGSILSYVRIKKSGTENNVNEYV